MVLCQRSCSGFYTKLLSSPSASLQEIGSAPEEPLFWPSNGECPMEPEPPVTTGFCPSLIALSARDPSIISELHVRVELQPLLEKLCRSSLHCNSSLTWQFEVDFIEVYAGSAKLSKSMCALGFRVGPPIELKQGWDMASESLFLLLLQLSKEGRIGLLWLGPPCTTFSLARFPRLRSAQLPEGLDVLDPDTAVGNLRLHLSLTLFVTQKDAENEAIVETPWSAFSRKLPFWRCCRDLRVEGRLDQCRYGTPYLKPTGLLATSSRWLSLCRRCNCTQDHEQLKGSRTSQAAEYPQLLCTAVAELSFQVAKDVQRTRESAAAHSNSLNGLPGELRDRKGSQRFVSHLWSTQLAEALPWKTRRAYRFLKPNHINLLEAHAHKTLMQLSPMDHRIVVFQDSVVTLGANAKGRSSSAALNRILRKSMALQLAKNLYPVGIHCPTWALRADDPSRRKRVKPSRAALPKWFVALKHGRKSMAQDLLDQCSGVPRSWGRWLLLGQAALFAVSGNFDSVSAWTQASMLAEKPAGSGSGASYGTHGSKQTASPRRVPGMDAFRKHGDESAAGGCQMGPHPVGHSAGGVWASAVRTGRFSAQLCRNINIVVQRCPYLKTFLAGPWKLLTTWESLFPGKLHPPVPLPLLKALVVTALAWQWNRLAMMLLIGFYALLRPCELIALKVSDCLLASETGYNDAIFLRLQLVKSRTRGARMQNVRLDVPFVVGFLKKCFRGS